MGYFENLMGMELSMYNIFGGYELFFDKDFLIFKLYGILIDLLIL